MKLISHRRNTIEELEATPRRYGVEVDIRSQGDVLTIHHDPFVPGTPFDEWLAAYEHGTLILNVKEEGLEGRLIDLMAAKGLNDFFFLDQSFPFIVRWSRTGERRCAVRVSEFESIETALTLTGRVDWVWVDCFTHFALKGEDAARLKAAGFKLCLVSPELQGRDAEVEISQLVEVLAMRNIEADAVCTKRPDLWERLVGSR
ncbi:phosphatidylinositol-specific phospholipase C/glycerophosphodiester phosphodiesterase family protein [Burkholderia vietnamiensis]|uniref:phosphatidylinositol-specific phospholipase C/glycerophosphodiester phosphodiesterase family protein n=1 Tax=Burkholderia vietnamiensis TaxID=60552 RepID=UPI0026532B52|nr:phosphatidylinositol-specific phospholipase C/glycerophosphodiester phosphodiesterase family protein [Burkholderia vietnamiensis]MDN8034174.1 phosphatidylinositol-specific phospholipase C/glycerophosphodiester phosphodiesterase family protein [Burkholderia vietnamiensis]